MKFMKFVDEANDVRGKIVRITQKEFKKLMPYSDFLYASNPLPANNLNDLLWRSIYSRTQAPVPQETLPETDCLVCNIL